MNDVKNIDFYLLRSPLLPLNLIEKLNIAIANKDIFHIQKEIKNIFKKPLLHKALLIASPNLYSEFVKWISNVDNNDDPPQKLIIALYKYLIRMSTRCTPFGIFAGCALGRFDYNTRIEINEINKHKVYCRPDSLLVNELADKISLHPQL